METPIEASHFRHWRSALWQQVRGPRVLELGVGTGKNFPSYRREWQVTAIDLSPRMLEWAERRARRDGVEVALPLGDAQALPFPDASFDTVVATFVFCSVPEPIQGLREAFRVLIPGGQLLLVEHVLSEKPLLRTLMHLANPLMIRMSGANIDRDTVQTVARAGFVPHQARNLWGDIVKLIEAAPPGAASTTDRVSSANNQGSLREDSASQDIHGSDKPKQSEGDSES